MSQTGDAVRLRHVLDAARKAIELAGGRSREQVEADEIGQLALARLLEIVGEAAGKVSPGFRRPPRDALGRDGGLRNRLAHAYFDVDLDVLLDVVTTDLPPLIKQVEGILGRP